MYASERPISFVVAAVSAKIKFLRFFLKFLNFIPTHRPIDHRYNIEGTFVRIEDGVLIAKGTQFSKLKKGDSIKI
jgi:1-acyl-sn-glycerol-3-phosphate acyltransferase